MSDDSSSKPAPKLPALGWALFDSVVLWLIAYRAPQYFASELAPFFLPLLPQAENVQNAVFYLVVEVITVAILAIFMRVYALKLGDLGLTRLKWNFIPKALLGYVVYFGLTILFLVIGQQFGLNVDEEQKLGFSEPKLYEDIMIFTILVLVVPFVEELLFRGFLFRALRQRLSFVLTTLIVSALFGLAHGLIGVGIDVFALSLVLCFLRERTQSLWPGIILHSFKNAVAFFILFIYNGQ